MVEAILRMGIILQLHMLVQDSHQEVLMEHQFTEDSMGLEQGVPRVRLTVVTVGSFMEYIMGTLPPQVTAGWKSAV